MISYLVVAATAAEAAHVPADLPLVITGMGKTAEAAVTARALAAYDATEGGPRPAGASGGRGVRRRARDR